MPHSRANFVAFLTKYNKMKKYYLLIAIIVLSICSLSAQKPIKWRSSIKMINETEGIVSMKAIIEPGWHLYGTNLKFYFSKKDVKELLTHVSGYSQEVVDRVEQIMLFQMQKYGYLFCH